MRIFMEVLEIVLCILIERMWVEREMVSKYDVEYEMSYYAW